MTILLYCMYTPDLTEQEKTILKFTEKNQGCSKQLLVDEIKGKYSRATVFKILHSLEEFELIYVIPNPENRQTKSVYLGNGGIINRVNKELDSLQSAVKGIINALHKSNISNEDAYEMYHQVMDIFSDVMRSYLGWSVVRWPRETKNKKILERTYGILFLRISEMVSYLSHNYYPVEDEGIDELIVRYPYYRIQQIKDNLLALKKSSKGTDIEEKSQELLLAIQKISESENIDEKSHQTSSIQA